MSEQELTSEPVLKATVKLSVEPEKITKLAVGSRWEVVDSSLSSLRHGPHTVTLRQVDDGGDERASR